VKVLFVLSQTNLTRHFDSVLLALADRGHRVHIASTRVDRSPLPHALATHPGISEGVCPDARGDRWEHASKTLRGLADYVRYLDPAFAHAPKLRDRAFRAMAKALTADERTHVKVRCPRCEARVADDDAGRLFGAIGEPAVSGLADLLARIERSVPPDPGHVRYLEEQRPDLLLVTPLVNLEMSQADWVKAGRAAGVPVGFPVFSWDNLTTKGLVHEAPDRVFVWNAIQRREAAVYHRIPAGQVEMTGATRFDAFFAMTPGADRRAFCRRVGFDPGRPILCYLCSSEFVAEREVGFVRRWVAAVRADPRLSACAILVRPHPRTLDQWIEPGALRGIAGGEAQIALAGSRGMNADQTLYDALYHSAAVVGLNTSAQIEAGILGKPVCTLVAPEFARGQAGTLHFQYLLRSSGGFVEMAGDMDEHRAHLASALEGRYDRLRIRDFIGAFVRPHGLDRPATPILADAIERLAS
jgi:hypothetical protein